jgi:hypothetical protein
MIPSLTASAIAIDRDARRGRVSDLADIEVELFRRKAGSGRQFHHHRAIRLVWHHQVDRIKYRASGIVRIARDAQLLHHLREVASHERLHFRPVDGDAVVELGIRPDDRIDLLERAARVSLEGLDIGRRTGWSGTQDERGSSIAENHARGADAADLVGKLLTTLRTSSMPTPHASKNELLECVACTRIGAKVARLLTALFCTMLVR